MKETLRPKPVSQRIGRGALRCYNAVDVVSWRQKVEQGVGLHYVGLWFWPLDEVRGPFSLLSSQEQARAGRILDVHHRNRFVAGRIGLRQILALQTNRAAGELSFVENEFGKPRLIEPADLWFNLSHSGDRAVLATCRTLEVGVDLEQIKPVEHLELAQRHFHTDEVRWLTRLPASQQLVGFLQLWTLKEAVVKALGKGLSIPLDAFRVSIGANDPELHSCEPDIGRGDVWALRLWNAGPEHVCAVAVPGAGADVVFVEHAP